MTLVDDPEGFPLLLAAGTATPPKEPPVAPPSKPKQGTGRPPRIDPGEWARRMDAVREAAREFETFSDQDIEEWLRGRTNRDFTPEEISSFTADVKASQLDDILDMLDQAERGTRRGRRTVRITAPRGYIRKTLGALSDDELKGLVERLRARGWKDAQVQTFKERLPEKRKGAVDGAPQEAGSMASVEYDAVYSPPIDLLDATRDFVAEVAAAMPAPVVQVAPSVVRRRVLRDPNTQLITDIEEVRVDGGEH